MKFWWKVVKILIWLKLLPVFVCSFVASRDNFQMVQTLAHLPWWRACSLLIISFSIDGVWKTEKREIESACKTQSMKCKYVVKFRLVQTISQTVFYMRNFTTLYMFACCTAKSTLFIIMTISHQLGGWLKWNAFLSQFEWIQPFENSGATAKEAAKWKCFAQLVWKKKFQNHVEIKMFNIFSSQMNLLYIHQIEWAKWLELRPPKQVHTL